MSIEKVEELEKSVERTSALEQRLSESAENQMKEELFKEHGNGGLLEEVNFESTSDKLSGCERLDYIAMKDRERTLEDKDAKAAGSVEEKPYYIDKDKNKEISFGTSARADRCIRSGVHISDC